jgi:hypothetical protein
MQHKLTLLFLFAALVAFTANANADDFILTQLGPGGPANWGLLAGPVATDIHINGPGQSAGDVGISAGTLSLDQSVSPGIIGNVYLDTGASVTHSNLISGSVITGANGKVDPAVAAALSAGSTFASLAPTITNITAFNGAMTINAAPNANGVTVIDLTGGINLGNASAVVTLVGSATDEFVINVSNQFKMGNGATIQLSGGLIPANVVFNVESSVSAVVGSGGLNQEPVINGILLANGAKLQFATMMVNGEIFTNAKGDQFASGSTFVQVPPPGGQIPEPVTLLLIAPALAALLIMRRRSSQPAAK